LCRHRQTPFACLGPPAFQVPCAVLAIRSTSVGDDTESLSEIHDWRPRFTGLSWFSDIRLRLKTPISADRAGVSDWHRRFPAGVQLKPGFAR
jgi:hypothetical protein